MERSEQNSASSSESFFAKTILLFVVGNILPAAKDQKNQLSQNSTNSSPTITKQSAKLRRRVPTNNSQVLTAVAIVTILLIISPIIAADCDGGVGAYPADVSYDAGLQDCICNPDQSTGLTISFPDSSNG